MNKKFVIKNSYEFNQMIKNCSYLKDKNVVIYYKDNSLGYSRYGISVGSKFGDAVVRNLQKRRIRNILQSHKMGYHNSKDYIIIIRKNGMDCSYSELETSILSILEKLK